MTYYNAIKIVTDNGTIYEFRKIIGGTVMVSATSYYSGYARIYGRNITFNSETVLNIGSGTQATTSNNQNVIVNSVLKPVYIVGIKYNWL